MAAILLTVSGWFLAHPEVPPVGTDAATGEQHPGEDLAAAAMRADGPDRPRGDPDRGGERTVAEAEPPRDARRGPARICGRCVDGHGTPLRGAVVLGSPRVELPIDRTEHACAADGAFALVVPASVPLELILRAPGRASRSAPIARVDPGTTLDLGDVVLAPGCRVSGTVRSVDGAAQEGVLVMLQRELRGPELRLRTRPLRTVEARSDGSGGLLFNDWVEPGRWRVLSSRLVQPVEVQKILPGASHFVVDVQIKDAAPTDEIAGTVLDDQGQPLARATVRAVRARTDGGRAAAGVATCDTAADGGFVLRRGSTAEPVTLAVEAHGFETEREARVREWGERGIRVHLRRAVAIAVRASLPDGRPLDSFALYVFGARPTDLNELRARSRGRQEDGVAYAYGVRPGEHVVLVESLTPGLAQGDLLRFRHLGGGARLDVGLDFALRRRVRCVDEQRQPVGGAVVELLLPLTESAVTRQTPAARLMDLWRCRGDRALRIASGVTDANGVFEVQGHPEARYTLRVKSLYHGSYLGDFVLGSALSLTEVRMPKGATVRGQLLPAQFTKQLGELGGKPKVALVSGLAGESTVRIEASPPVDGEGRFAFTHVDPGDWRLELSWQLSPLPSVVDREPIKIDHRSGRSGLGSGVHLVRPEPKPPSLAPAPQWRGHLKRTLEVATLPGIAEGETRHVAVRADHLLLGSLRGRVERPGAPLKQAYLVPTVAGAGTEVSLELAEGGAFWVWADPGTYTIEIEDRGRRRARATAAQVTVVPGQAAEVVFEVDAIEVEFAVVDAAGTAAAKTSLRLRADGAPADDVAVLPATDAQGKTWANLRPGKYRVVRDETTLAEFAVPLAVRGAVRVTLPR